MRGFLQIPTLEDVNTCLEHKGSNAKSFSTDAKHTSTASSKKRKSHLEPSLPLRAQFENISTLKRRRPKPSRTRSYFSPQQTPRLPEKNAMFPANPNIQIASMMCDNEAFVRCFLQIPKAEDVKTKLSCEASVKFQKLKM